MNEVIEAWVATLVSHGLERRVAENAAADLVATGLMRGAELADDHEQAAKTDMDALPSPTDKEIHRRRSIMARTIAADLRQLAANVTRGLPPMRDDGGEDPPPDMPETYESDRYPGRTLIRETQATAPARELRTTELVIRLMHDGGLLMQGVEIVPVRDEEDETR